jgi:hypothetical protein
MKKWSRNYDFCITCNLAINAHKGHGNCVVCYDKKRDRADEKSRLSQSKYRANNREKIKESNKKLHQKNRNKLMDLLGNKCSRCGFSDYRALQIDHIHGGGIKERSLFNTKDYHRHVIKSLMNNENKYQLLCANCNWIKRSENKEWGRGVKT